MSEFKKVESASQSPTRCAFCGAHEGPFIDTHCDTPVYGHIYVCAATARRAGCARQIGRLDGMTDPATVSDLEHQIAGLLEETEVLKAELAEAQENTINVVSLDEALARIAAAENPPTTKRMGAA